MGKRVGAKRLRERAGEGRGSGQGPEYEGLIGVRDFSSKGFSHRILGHKTNRMHHLFSNLELSCYYLLDWCDNVTDILDQAALNLDETQAIAGELGYKHPGAGADGPVPMTTDLIAVYGADGRGSRLAVAVKPSKEIGKRRVAEKLEIERQYWGRQGVPWQIVTERQFDSTVISNLGHLYSYRSLERYDVPEGEGEIQSAIHYLLEQLRDAPGVAYARICKAVDERLHLPKGAALAMGLHATATKQWRVDLRQAIRGHLPLPLIQAE